MKVFLSAYACEPNRGSEPGIGWNWVRQIARVHEVWVITRANNQGPIEQALEKNPLPNVHWIYFDLPPWLRFWKKRQKGLHLYYYLWQIGIYFHAKKLHERVKFDLIHHITFANYWQPSFLPLLKVPFILGPVGGGESAPKSFYHTFSLRGRIYEYMRGIARWFGEHDPFVLRAARRAEIALAATEETGLRLKRLGCRKVEVFASVALPQEEIDHLNSIQTRRESPFRSVSIGSLLHLKGFHLGLMAFANFNKEFPDSDYWIIGDGPERKNLQRLARRLGVEDKVRFLGRLNRNQIFKKLSECDVLVHPSLHDSGGCVVLEAMAAGKPVICLDLGGPSQIINSDAGFKIRAVTSGSVIDGIADAMKELTKNRYRRRMSELARQRVREAFDYGLRSNHLLRIYGKIKPPE